MNVSVLGVSDCSTSNIYYIIKSNNCKISNYSNDLATNMFKKVDSISIKCYYEKKTLLSNTYFGTITIDNPKNIKQWFPIISNRKYLGQLHIKIELLNNDTNDNINNMLNDINNEELNTNNQVINKEILNSLKRSLNVLEEGCDMGEYAISKLKKQGEKMDEFQQDLYMIDYNTDIAKRHIRSINSVWGTLANNITKPKFKNKIKKDSINVEKLYIQDNKYINLDNATEEEILDKMSNKLDNLKIMADNINSILQNQNKKLDKITGKINKNNIDISKITQKAKNI